MTVTVGGAPEPKTVEVRKENWPLELLVFD